MEFYMRNGGKMVPVKIEKLITNDWEDSIITVVVGGRNGDPPTAQADALHEFLSDNSSISKLGAEFIVSEYDLKFEILSKKNDLKDKYIAVQNDNQKEGGWLKSVAHKMGGKCRGITEIPSITIEEYRELLEIKRRCDLRRQRRNY